jgi:hypothetical protein
MIYNKLFISLLINNQETYLLDQGPLNLVASVEHLLAAYLQASAEEFQSEPVQHRVPLAWLFLCRELQLLRPFLELEQYQHP